MKLFLSTIDPNARDIALRYGLGLEIAEYCTAWNMDEQFPQTDALVRRKLEGIPERILPPLPARICISGCRMRFSLKA